MIPLFKLMLFFVPFFSQKVTVEFQIQIKKNIIQKPSDATISLTFNNNDSLTTVILQSKVEYNIDSQPLKELILNEGDTFSETSSTIAWDLKKLRGKKYHPVKYQERGLTVPIPYSIHELYDTLSFNEKIVKTIPLTIFYSLSPGKYKLQAKANLLNKSEMKMVTLQSNTIFFWVSSHYRDGDFSK